jgi:hypothetical protein
MASRAGIIAPRQKIDGGIACVRDGERRFNRFAEKIVLLWKRKPRIQLDAVCAWGVYLKIDRTGIDLAGPDGRILNLGLVILKTELDVVEVPPGSNTDLSM